MNLDVRVQPLGDEAGFAREWARLYERAVNGTPFQSSAWIETWLSAAAPRCRLLTVRATANGEAVALGVLGVPPRGPARLAESGDPALDDIYVEYNDILLSEGAPRDARRLVVAALLDHVGSKGLVLRNVPPPLRQAALAAGRDAGWVVRVVMENPCFGRDLTEPDPASRNTRQQVARAKRLYEARGPLSLEVARTPQDRAAALPALIGLHEAVWQARGRDGAFANAALRGFHEALIARDDQGTEIVTLRAGDAPVGMLYNLVSAEGAYNYQSGFAFEADNKLKPGLLTHSLAMAHYAERGLGFYDMMAGDARYKASLGVPTRRLSTLELERPSLRQKLRGVARNFRR